MPHDVLFQRIPHEKTLVSLRKNVICTLGAEWAVTLSKVVIGYLEVK